jgi:ribosomal protein L12E/L44/L45/RPP1/RPP2
MKAMVRLDEEWFKTMALQLLGHLAGKIMREVLYRPVEFAGGAPAAAAASVRRQRRETKRPRPG